ncbi:MAG: HIT domain-containing protein [Myxococcota bacterium]
MAFELHPRLEADTRRVDDWPLSRVLLMDDARFPWLILVPRVPEAREIHRLEPAQRATLLDELVRAAEALESVSGAPKLNLGALGNLVPQLHVHVVARSPDDAAWPGPVWGAGEREPWEPAAADAWIERFRAAAARPPGPAPG